MSPRFALSTNFPHLRIFGSAYRMSSICRLLFAIWALAACSGNTQPQAPTAEAAQSSAVTPAEPALAAAATATTPPRAAAPTEDLPAETVQPPHTRYTLSILMNYDTHHLQVDEQIRYTNPTTETISDLRLMVEPMYYPGTFRLDSLKWLDPDGGAIEQTTWKGTQLSFPLRQPLAPGESLGLAISYQLDLPSPVPSATTRPVPFGYTQRQANLVDWYPFVPPYLPGKGWLAHDAGFFGEHLAYEKADFEVSIQFENPRPGLTVAASAAAAEGGRYQLSNARNFAWSVSDQYQVLTQTVGDTTVTSYAFSYHVKAGEAALKTTAEALALYQELFGPYAHQTLSVVEADFLDGMEYEGLYFLSNGFYNLYQGTPGEYLIAIAAHETAHQWWYAQVGNDQAQEPWLDEALCTYSERMFFEKLYPEVLQWWWDYRVNYYHPAGWVDGSIYNPNGYRAYRDAVYLNGALFLEDLRTLTGDDAFFAFIQDYAQQEANRIATGSDFFRILSEHTNADLSLLKKKYFNSP